MSDLTVVKITGPEEPESLELEYLLSICLLEARSVFGTVDLVRILPGQVAPGSSSSAVLVLDAGGTLFTARSLRRMHGRLAEGYRLVAPVRLDETELGRRPIYSLRGYERAEEEHLAAVGNGPPGEVPILPMALVAADGYNDSLAGRPLGDSAAAPPDLARGGAREGLCHRFIDYYGEVRADVLVLLPPAPRDLLEVGCGRGLTGELLQQRLGCRVTGIEINPAAAREASQRLHRVVTGDVSTLELDGSYDAVVAFELFEHLTRPEEFLTRVAPLVRPGGRIVLSVPNVGHYSVVEDLLAGRWDYLPIGLLCYTHYRFFTRRTLTDWLRRCGFERFEILPQRTEMSPELAALAGIELDLDSLSTKGFYVVVEL